MLDQAVVGDFALALLIDTSASMETRLSTAQEATIGFARRLRPQDLAEIVDFDSRVVILQPFVNDIPALEQAIRKTSAGGSTSMYNAVYIALKDLKRIVATSTDEIRRQAIVLLSDGEDTSSLLPFEEVLDLAKRDGLRRRQVPPHLAGPVLGMTVDGEDRRSMGKQVTVLVQRPSIIRMG